MFIKNSLQHRCFAVNIAAVLRTPILKNICKLLLLITFVLLKSYETFQNDWFREHIFETARGVSICSQHLELLPFTLASFTCYFRSDTSKSKIGISTTKSKKRDRWSRIYNLFYQAFKKCSMSYCYWRESFHNLWPK